MPGTLFVVATPIGNLEDITLRALRVLREVGLIAAEDTRRTAKLLNHYEIRTPTTSFHAHNERAKTPRILARLTGGADVALVSDAGTPTLSDPGAALVEAALAAGIRVVPVPGASAILAAYVASSPRTPGFAFVGFPPNRSSDRKRWLLEVGREPRPVILFEAPHRLRQTLEDMLLVLGDREIVVGRELTKAHEQLVKGPITTVLPALTELRGEFTVVVSPDDTAQQRETTIPADHILGAEFGRMVENEGFERRAAVALLASRYQLPQRQVYSAILRFRKSGECPT
jgi:16S rRNA (cytidine1402-2'-O)-methyltransferase